VCTLLKPYAPCGRAGCGSHGGRGTPKISTQNCLLTGHNYHDVFLHKSLVVYLSYAHLHSAIDSPQIGVEFLCWLQMGLRGYGHGVIACRAAAGVTNQQVIVPVTLITCNLNHISLS